MDTLAKIAKKWLSDVRLFSRIVVRRPLRKYQAEPAAAIVDSVLYKRGREFAIMFPRQSGKNEMQAQLQAYLLNLFQRVQGAQIVAAAPTMKPQSQNAMRRLEQTLTNDWNHGQWRKREGYLVQLGQALIAFFSAEPGASVVGATANILLMCDEAQDVQEAQWAKKFEPMAASTNATVAYFGTAWTSQTMLAKVVARLKEQEAADGVRRVFVVTPDQVSAENPPYGDFIQRQVAKYGRHHPLVKTQFFNEAIDAEGGMFPPARRALMRGQHPPQDAPTPGKVYALLLDVAGEDEGALEGAAASLVPALENPRRDSTALTVVEVDTATVADPIIRAPTYKVVSRHTWIGVKHTALYAQIRALAIHWQARYLVADATGVGAGLVSFLDRALPGRVIPFDFTGPSKSQLGWDFLAICDTGRWQDYLPLPLGEGRGEGDVSRETLREDLHNEGAEFWHQLEFTQYEIRPGPQKLMRWGVPDGTRDPATGELVHDDLVLSAALSAVLDQQDWSSTSPTLVVRGHDPLDKLSRGY